jgi:ABC-type transport system involved in multi-copper enzyme maturation permease subunit
MRLAILRSELTKLRTLRSAMVCLGVLLLLEVGLGAVAGWSVQRAIAQGTPPLSPDWDPESAGLSAIGYSQFALIVFGVLTVSHEYTSGTIRQSLLAVPRRGAFYAAKLLVSAAVSMAVAVPAVFFGYLATEAGLGRYGTTLGAPQLPRAMAGGVLYLVLTGLFCAGVAAALRSPVAALAVLAPLYFFVSQLLTTIHATGRFAAYLPDQAGLRMFAVGTAHHAARLGPGGGMAVLVLWVCLAVGAGYLRLRQLEP